MRRDTDRLPAICYALIFILILVASCAVSNAGQAYYSPISVNSGQVPSTQTDFPVLVSQTDNRFKTIGNGSHVANSNGYDIRPYSDSGLTTAITGYELERYNSSTGEVVMWVKVGSLSSSTTPIYLGYGDTTLTTDGSSTATWSNSFLFVYHFPNGSTLSSNDSTGSYNLTSHNTPTAGTGKIDGAVNLVRASDQYLDNSSFSGGSIGTSLTASVWINGSTFTGAYNAPAMMDNNGYIQLFVKSTGKLAFYITSPNVFYDGSGTNTLSTGTWYLLHCTYSNAAGLKGYLNGSVDGSAASGGDYSGLPPRITVGKDQNNAGRGWDGLVDEYRLASIARSADWITTEYNNQSAPATFETLGSEVAVSNSASSNFFYMFGSP